MECFEIYIGRLDRKSHRRQFLIHPNLEAFNRNQAMRVITSCPWQKVTLVGMVRC